MWGKLKLGDILVLEYGKPLKKSERDAFGEYVVAGSNGSDGNHSKAFVEGPGIVVGRKGSAGKVAWYDKDFWPIDTTFYVRPKIECEKRWLFYLLNYMSLERLAIITGVPGLNRDNAYSQDISLPALSEQEKIVEILDAADDLRQRRAEADKKAAKVLPALFYEMFGDPATNPMGWKVKTLGKLVIETPQYGANASGVPWSKDKPRYIRITDIKADGVLQEDGIVTLDMDDWEPYRLYDGDLLFARSGNTVGKTYLFKEKDGLCAFAGYLIRFKLNKQEINPLYAFAFTQTPVYQGWVDSKKRTAGQPNINGKEYASLQIPCPPKALQDKFIEMAEEALNICTQNSQAILSLNQMFDVLMHRAFSGELTAGWRERNKAKLEKELAEQMKAIEAAKTSDTGKRKKNRKNTK